MSTGWRSEGTRKGIKIWIERLTIDVVRKLGFRGLSFRSKAAFPKALTKARFNVQAFRLAAVVPISILPQPLSGRGRDRRSQSLDPR